MFNKAIPKWVPKKYHDMVEGYSNETGSGDGHWLYLKDHLNHASGGRAIHENTITEVLSELRHNCRPMTEDEKQDPFYN